MSTMLTMYRCVTTLPRKVYSCLFVPQVTKGSRDLYMKHCLHTSNFLTFESREIGEQSLVPEATKDTFVEASSEEVPRKSDRIPVRVTDKEQEELDKMRLDFPTGNTGEMMIDNQRFDEIPVVHLKSSKNNTFLTLAKANGKTLVTVSCGALGFRHTKKSSDLAGQACGLHIAEKAKEIGIETIRVAVKGLGPGRRSGIQGLQMGGIRIVSITDATAIPFNGNRPRAVRRT